MRTEVLKCDGCFFAFDATLKMQSNLLDDVFTNSLCTTKLDIIFLNNFTALFPHLEAISIVVS